MTETNSSMTAERTVVVISDDAQLQQALSSAPYAVLNFWADWAPQCAQMNAVFAQLSAKHGSWLRFYQVHWYWQSVYLICAFNSFID
jgi:thioredoxin-like negative regulator of GroEL